MKNIIIVGAGGVGRETAWIIEQINIKKETYKILGFIDDNESIWNSNINGYKVLGGLDYLLENKMNSKIVVSIADYKIKKYIVEKLNSYEFETIIHPDVFIHSSNKIGKGTIIYPGTIMTTNITIGNHVIISPKVGIGHDSKIEDYVSILWNVSISGFDYIKEGTFIGSNATIIQGKMIGENTVIGAGAVVINNLEKNVVAIGIPAQKVRLK